MHTKVKKKKTQLEGGGPPSRSGVTFMHTLTNSFRCLFFITTCILSCSLTKVFAKAFKSNMKLTRKVNLSKVYWPKSAAKQPNNTGKVHTFVAFFFSLSCPLFCYSQQRHPVRAASGACMFCKSNYACATMNNTYL